MLEGWVSDDDVDDDCDGHDGVVDDVEVMKGVIEAASLIARM